MFGLFFFGILGLWGLLCLYLASRWLARPLMNKFGSRFSENTKPLGNFVLTALLASVLFFLPVVDEIIAKPQMDALCTGAGEYQYAPGMDEKKAFGRTVYEKHTNDRRTLFPNIPVVYEQSEYIDVATGEIVLRYHAAEALRSMFAFPNAAGGRVTWILRACGYASSAAGKENRTFFYDKLQLKKIDLSTPKTREAIGNDHNQ